MMDTYLVCEQHGDVFVQRDCGLGGIPLAAATEPLRDDVQRPREGDAIVCPLCGQWLRPDHRNATP